MSDASILRSLRRALVAAPMAGGPSTPELVVAATEAGGTAFLAGGYLTAERLRQQIDEVVGSGVDTFGVNLFVPEAVPLTDEVRRYRDRLAEEADGIDVPEPREDDDGWGSKLDTLLARPVPMVSFTFGFPDREVVESLRAAGSTVVATVANVADARVALDRGADVLCIQGPQAGGHRATFDQAAPLPEEPLEEMLDELRGSVPLIAAGGAATAEDVDRWRARGADAVQVGTALLVSDEAGTDPRHRQELLAGAREVTATRAFSGRWARGLANDFTRRNADAPSGYPYINQVTGPLRADAKRRSDPEGMSLWAGDRYRSVRPWPAAEILERLCPSARGS